MVLCHEPSASYYFAIFVSRDGPSNCTGKARSQMINASPSTSTRRNPNFALNLTAWTHASASTANAIVSKLILTFVILEGFQYSLNTELTGPLDTQPGPHYISKRAALEHMNCGFETVDASRAICNIP